MELEPVIGLEIHVQLKTKSKMFCSCDNAGENQPPNTTICEICTGQPGTLPMLNEQAVDFGIRIALALNCRIPHQSVFSRKSYFYPDLPKGYQISQYDQPIALEGQFTFPVDGETKTVGIIRVHLEEDTAKMTHLSSSGESMLDYNRAGTPLVEIVTQPDFHTPQEAKRFLQELRLLFRYLDVSDADMEKGHLRCDANISLRPVGELKYYTKIEIKNLNSFRSVEKALQYEIERQTKLWEAGQAPNQHATRGWNDQRNITVEQRTKEGEADYRYFPEPDLPPLKVTQAEIEKMRITMPELPSQARIRLNDSYGLSITDIDAIVSDRVLLEYYESTMSELEAWQESEGLESEPTMTEESRRRLSKTTVNWLIHKLLKMIADSKSGFEDLKITPENFAEFINLIDRGKLHSAISGEVLNRMFATGQDPSSIIEERGLNKAGTLEDLDLIIVRVLNAHPKQIAQYQSGKIVVLQYLIGQVMKETKGSVNPDLIKDALLSKLK
jgi:aspartyl-tRNA(Asn)/glutamyl-tRNA(Gln) amidotransferase subunit B